MPIQFPDNPSINETHSVNGRTYIWTGQKWRRRRPRIEYVPPTMEVVNDFTAGSALKVDADTSSVGIGTMTPNAGDALTVGGDTTVDGHINVYSSLTVGASAGFSGDVDVSGNLVVDGYITVPTQVAGTNDTKVATTEYVTNAIAGLVGGAPAALDTLNELAAALDNDASYATSITNALSLKLDSSSYTAADVLSKLITVDGAGSSLDADTLDGSHASAFASSSHTHSYAATSHTHSYHVAGGDYGTDFVANKSYADDWFRAKGDTGLYFEDKATGIRSVQSEGGQYGSVATYSGIGGWEGFSIGGRVVFMHNMSNNWGIYNDVNNEWMIYGALNGSVDLYYDNAVKLYTDGSGVTVNGRVHATDVMYVGNNGSGDSNIYFYDDNSNTWRTFQWDDSVNDWRVEDNGGTMRTLYHSGNIPSYYPTSGGTVSGSVNSSSYFYTYGGHQQILIGGTNGQGAIYLGTGVGASGTGGIEATWRNTTNPSIGIGVVRDSDRTMMHFNYNGNSYWYVDNTIRVICNTSGVQVQGTWTNYSSRALKENIRNSHLLDGATPLDARTTLDRWLMLQPRVFDWIEKPHDKWWVGCDEHNNRFECEAAGCPNDAVERIEHTCGKGWCYGTEDNPCPRYTGVRDRLHFIAEEVQDVLGDHVITLGEDRTVQGINAQAFTTEHVHATQQLIRYVRELESRIAVLEAN